MDAGQVSAGTREAFAEGAEFAGLFMQITALSAFAIALLICFYLIQRERVRRDGIVRDPSRGIDNN